MTLFPPNATKGGLFSNGLDAVLPLILPDLTLLLLHETGISKMFLSESSVCCQVWRGVFQSFSLSTMRDLRKKKKKANKRAALNQVGRDFQKLKAVAGMPVSLQIFISMTVKRKGNNKQKLSSFLTCSFWHLHGSNSMLIPEQSNNFFNESWIKMWFATANENAFCSNAGVLIELRRARRLERALNNMSQTFFIYFFCSLAVWCLQMGPAALGRN